MGLLFYNIKCFHLFQGAFIFLCLFVLGGFEFMIPYLFILLLFSNYKIYNVKGIHDVCVLRNPNV